MMAEAQQEDDYFDNQQLAQNSDDDKLDHQLEPSAIQVEDTTTQMQ